MRKKEIKPVKKPGFFKRYIVAGLLVWVPLGVTFLVLRALINLMDKTIAWIPQKYQPETLLGFDIPGLGVIFAVLIMFITGAIVANFFGNYIVKFWENLLSRIPLVSSIYSAVKQVVETFVSEDGKSFRKVLLFQYPREGLWTLGFQSGEVADEIQAKMPSSMVTLFVPTAPNPTSGFVIMLPQKDVIELEMSVEDGLRLIMSLGVVIPEVNPDKAKAQAEALASAS